MCTWVSAMMPLTCIIKFNFCFCCTGNKEHLYVEKELFQLEPRFSVYQFTANLRNIQGGQGYAGLKIRLNQPPAGGSCNVPSHNLTLGVAVRVMCEEWKDYEGIVSYKFFGEVQWLFVLLVSSLVFALLEHLIVCSSI